MNLENLLSSKKLVAYKPTKKQLEDLFALIARDINDAGIPALSTDRQFMSLYSAALLLTTVVLYTNGYRTRGEAHHHSSFAAGRILLPEEGGSIDYFDRCRMLRNKTEYERSGIISKSEVQSLKKKIAIFKEKIEKLAANHIS